MKKKLLLFKSIYYSSILLLCCNYYSFAYPITCHEEIFSIINERVREDIKSSSINSVHKLDNDISDLLPLYQEDGSFSGIDYSNTARSGWLPVNHLTYILQMSLGYTTDSSSYYQNKDLKNKIEKGLFFWYNKNPRSNNWWHNEIGAPQRLGKILLLLEVGQEELSRDLFNKFILRMATECGNPHKQAGANKIDVAIHYMYRACLTKDEQLMNEAISEIFTPLSYTTKEGIQYDNSYMQHGPQLYIGGYGTATINGITNIAMYLVGTEFALSGERLDILSKFVRETYLPTIRGENISFSVLGRGVTRKNALSQKNFIINLERMCVIDPVHKEDYLHAIARINRIEPANSNLKTFNIHYYCSDYTLHQRSGYTLDIRTVSNRTARNEQGIGNGEGYKQYFLSDGAYALQMSGDEYVDIFPVWNWAKIPGVTCPEFIEIPIAPSYITMGTSSFVGAASDSIYAVTAYQYQDNYENINSSAKKAWFLFDKEIVCLGSDINSSSIYNVNTTINQCLLDGNTYTFTKEDNAIIQNGDYSFQNNLKWVLHGGVGYCFPEGGTIKLTSKEQEGDWFNINRGFSKDIVKKEVFTLWLDHGLKPEKEKYAYIIVPGINTPSEIDSYVIDNIKIIANTDSIQAVYHKKLNILQLVFWQKGIFRYKDIYIQSDNSCALILKGICSEKATFHLADPSQSVDKIKIQTGLPGINGIREFTCDFSDPPYYKGKTKCIFVE